QSVLLPLRPVEGFLHLVSLRVHQEQCGDRTFPSRLRLLPSREAFSFSADHRLPIFPCVRRTSPCLIRTVSLWTLGLGGLVGLFRSPPLSRRWRRPAPRRCPAF